MTDEKLYATVRARGVIFSETNDVLILRDAETREWELPGGRLGQNETVVDGLKRELSEETSLEVQVSGPVHAHVRQSDDEGRFTIYYICSTDQRTVNLSDEHSESNWVSSVKTRSILSEPQAAAVRHASDRRRRSSADHENSEEQPDRESAVEPIESKEA